MIENVLSLGTVTMTEDEVRALNIPTLTAFLDDAYVTEITIRCMAHGFQPVIYRKTEPADLHTACMMFRDIQFPT
jgi:hypothetical protein